jgi:hypothetical protein
VEELAGRLKPLYTESRKVAGHQGDEWNDVVDRLAVKGRDEAGGLPKCSFSVHLATGTIPFIERPMSGSVTLNELWKKLQGKTSVILPDVTEFNIFKDSKGHSGHWVTGNYEFKLKRAPKEGIPPDVQRMERTMAQIGHMTTRREAGKGSGKAVSQMVEPTFSVWLDQISRNLMFEVPSRITMEQLV